MFSFMSPKPVYNFKGKYSAKDVAGYLVKKCFDDGEPISNLQLQKILYYVQKYFIQNEHRALFSDDLEAWQFGPVVRDVYGRYCMFGADDIFPIENTATPFTEDEKQQINRIAKEKRAMKPWDLVKAVHEKGKAWDLIYRDGLGDKDIIPKGVIANYG